MRLLVITQAPSKDSKALPYDLEAVTSQLKGYASPGTTVEVAFPDDFEGSKLLDTISRQSALNGLHHMMSVPAIVRKIYWAAENGYDAVISSNTFDPGVDGGRLAVRIPVIGLLRASMHTGLTLADRIGVMVPLASHVPYTRRLIRSYGLEAFVTEIRPIGIYEDMARRKAEIFDRTTVLVKSMVDNGAEIILPLGGVLIPYIVDPEELSAAAGVQILNTKAIGIRFAELCVSMNLTHSNITYPVARLESDDFVSRL